MIAFIASGRRCPGWSAYWRPRGPRRRWRVLRDGGRLRTARPLSSPPRSRPRSGWQPVFSPVFSPTVCVSRPSGAAWPSVALARADAAREVQLAEQAQIEELATGLQAQTRRPGRARRPGRCVECHQRSRPLDTRLRRHHGTRRGARCRGTARRRRHHRAREGDSWVVTYQHGLSARRRTAPQRRSGADRGTNRGDRASPWPQPI